MKRIKVGDRLNGIPADTWNQFVGAAEVIQGAQGIMGGRAGQGPRPQASVVLVENKSGYAVDWFGVLGIDGPLIAEATNSNEFKSRVMFTASTPDIDKHEGLFVVCIEAIPDGQIGKAVVSGVVQVQIDVTDADHTYAEIKDDDRTMLASGASGSARILWKATGTGTQWAIVRLGDGSDDQGGLWGKATAIWTDDATATGNGSFVNVNPCNRDGTGVDAGTTHKVWLPRNGRREDPNVQADAVIPYIAEAEGDYVNESGCLDGKIDETIRMHADPANIPPGWSELAASNGRVLISADGAHYSGTTGGTVNNPPPWTSGGPSATDSAMIDTNPGAPQTVATEDHTHDVDPKYYYVGLIYRSS